MSALPRGLFTAARRYDNLVGFSGFVRPAVIRALSRRADVDLVYIDGTVHALLAEGVPLVAVKVLAVSGRGAARTSRRAWTGSSRTTTPAASVS